VSYLGRNDLAHVDPREIIGGTGLGSSDDQTDEQLALDLPQSVSKVVSKGLVRGASVVKLAARSVGKTSVTETSAAIQTASLDIGARSIDSTLTHGANALALAEHPVEMRAPAPATATQPMSKSELFKQRATEAKLRGYEGVACTECYNFTMVRNGTCLKCDTCGSTSGCS
jgi:ribonucleoside-diphosphate reductase alpha chain